MIKITVVFVIITMLFAWFHAASGLHQQHLTLDSGMDYPYLDTRVIRVPCFIDHLDHQNKCPKVHITNELEVK